MTSLHDTVERINPVYFRSKEKYLLYLRHVFAYEYVLSQLPPSVSLLEIGCGEGYGARMLADAGHNVLAIDVDAEAVTHAQRAYGTPTCRFRTYDGERLPFEDGAFAYIVSMQVIEHVPDDARFVREAERVLQPEGVCWFTTPNRTHRIPEGGKIWNPFHVREYYPHELETVLQSHFPDAAVWGIRGTDEVQQIEYARVKRGLSIRKLIPEPIKAWLDGDVRARYTTAVYRATPDEISGSLDLLGICRKPAATP